MIPNPWLILAAFIKKNLIPIIGAGLIVLIVMLAFNHWKEGLIESGREEVRQQWLARDEDTARQTDELIKRKTQEAKAINQLNQERANNAIQIYAKHYDELRRAADAAPKRLYVSAKATSCSGNALSGSSQSSNGFGQGTEGISKAVLRAKQINNNEIIITPDFAPFVEHNYL